MIKVYERIQHNQGSFKSLKVDKFVAIIPNTFMDTEEQDAQKFVKR